MRTFKRKISAKWMLWFCLLVLSTYLTVIIIPQIALAKSKEINVKARGTDGSTKEIQLYSGYYALVVGCADYRMGWPRLPNPVKDAQEVASMLKRMGWTVDVIENPDGMTLRNELNRLVAGYGRNKENAILLWYSGHGHTVEEADNTKLGYLIPVNTPDPEKDLIGFMNTAVSMRQIETIAKQIRSKHVLMTFDSCFSGAIFQMVRAKPSPYIQEKVAYPVREFITAGTENEKVPDKSVFKEVFIQGIKDGFADLNEDSYVTGEELGSYLQEKVINYSRRAQHPQFGKINNPKLDKGDFVFARKESDELSKLRLKVGRLLEENKLLRQQIEKSKQQAAKSKDALVDRRTSVEAMARLTVDAGVSDATVLVDDRIVGKTPLSDFSVSLGEHKIKVEKEGYKSYSKKIKFEKNWKISLNVDLKEKKPRKGRIYVETEPTGARVKILNIGPKFYQGIELVAGRYHVEVSAPGFKIEKKWVSLDAGEEKRVTIRAEKEKPKKGRLFVKTKPEAPEIKFLNWKDKFYQGIELEPGEYHIEISANRYETKRVRVSLEAGKDRNLNIHLEKKLKMVGRDGQFVAYENGIMKDTVTGLEWVAGPDRDMDWYEAKSWVENLTIDGGGWRMPTRKELRTLYKKGEGTRNMTPLLKITGWWVWSGETKGSSSIWYFLFGPGFETWRPGDSSRNGCGFAVRSRRDSEPTASMGSRFIISGQIVTDHHTNLEWIAGPDRDINWYEAKKWVDKLTIDGGGWRMPSIAELKTLYQKGIGERNMTPLLNTTGGCVWSSETDNSSLGLNFTFYDGMKYWHALGSSINNRAFAVRSRR